MSRRSRLGWLFFTLSWSVLLAYGLREQFRYATTPGVSGAAPELFPADSRLPRAHQHSTLFMFVHPECPCTRASLQELSELIAGQSDKVSPVLVIAPALSADGADGHREHKQLARDNPSLVLFVDRDGVEAKRFGAETSGHVVLYDALGRLQFTGGITGSRGHVGDNVGLRTVKRLIQQSTPAAQQHAVYGCPLEANGAR